MASLSVTAFSDNCLGQLGFFLKLVFCGNITEDEKQHHQVQVQAGLSKGVNNSGDKGSSDSKIGQGLVGVGTIANE